MNNTLKLGLILSVISIFSLFLYKFVLPYEVLFSWKQMVISFAIQIAITIWFGRKLLRDPEEGRLGYGQAVKKLFIAYLISVVIVSLGSIALFGNDDIMKSEFIKHNNQVQEASTRMLSSMTGGSEADQEAAVEQMRELRRSGGLPEPMYPYSFSSLPMMLFVSSIGSIIMALILALFIREKEDNYSGVIDT